MNSITKVSPISWCKSTEVCIFRDQMCQDQPKPCINPHCSEGYIYSHKQKSFIWKLNPVFFRCNIYRLLKFWHLYVLRFCDQMGQDQPKPCLNPHCIRGGLYFFLKSKKSFYFETKSCFFLNVIFIDFWNFGVCT